MRRLAAALAPVLLAALPAAAAGQGHPPGHAHAPGMAHPGAAPAEAGQGAFAALAEVVRILEADPATDWSRVDLERLRRHLADMDAVVLRARVHATPVPGGARMDVTGEGGVRDAIARMVPAHAAELDGMPGYAARAEPIPGGVRLTVTAAGEGDTRTEAKIRALGFAGLLASGGHHGPHHLAMARGEMGEGHHH